MGFLTTITFYNDGISQIEKNFKEFKRIILHAANNTKGSATAGLGNHANLVTMQKTRHMDDSTLYMHSGNTVVDVYEADSEWAIDTFLAEMKYHTKRLKQIKKDRKDAEKNKLQTQQ